MGGEGRDQIIREKVCWNPQVECERCKLGVDGERGSTEGYI